MRRRSHGCCAVRTARCAGRRGLAADMAGGLLAARPADRPRAGTARELRASLTTSGRTSAPITGRCWSRCGCRRGGSPLRGNRCRDGRAAATVGLSVAAPRARSAGLSAAGPRGGLRDAGTALAPAGFVQPTIGRRGASRTAAARPSKPWPGRTIGTGNDADCVKAQANGPRFERTCHAWIPSVHRSRYGLKLRHPAPPAKRRMAGRYSTPSVSPVGGGNSRQQSSSQARKRTTLGNE